MRCRYVEQYSHTIMGWATIYKKCGPMPGKNSIDAEIAGCSVLVESLKKKVGHMCACSLRFTLVSLALMHTPASTCGCPGSGVRCFVVRVGLWRRVGCSVCQKTSNLPRSVRKLELGMSEIALFGRKKDVGRYFVEKDNSLIASSRRDGIAYVRKTVQKAGDRRESVNTAPKETSDGRTLVVVDKSPIGTRETTYCRERVEQGQQLWTLRRTFLLDAVKAVRNFREFRQHPILKCTSSCASWNKDVAASETVSLLMTVSKLGHGLGRRCGRAVEKKGKERNIQGNGPGYVGLGHENGRRSCWALLLDLIPVVAVLGRPHVTKRRTLSGTSS